MSRYRCVIFDCDSTLSTIEGIEVLAAAHREEVAALTDAAMRGEIPLEQVYGRRLDLVRPTRDAVAALGRRYVETLVPDAAEVVVDWPHRHLDAIAGGLDARTVICVLTHDAKFDIPLLRRALELPVGYVGVMGSRRTHAERLRRLRDAGAGEEALARLRSPIGLDLGAHTPEETALSIAAEIVAARTGGSGAPLTGVEGPIHAASAVPHS